jgi:hypothetical protein
MNKQQMTRRLVLGGFAVALALPGFGAAAAGEDFADDIASGAQMQGICEDFGGIFTDTQDGNLWCQWDDGSQTVCDEDGKDCHDIPFTPPPPGRWDLPGIVVDPVMVADPVSDPPTGSDDQRSVTPLTSDRDQDLHPAQKAKHGKKGKKGKKGGKHHKR